MLISNHAPMPGTRRGRSMRPDALELAEQLHEAELVVDMTHDFGTPEAQAQAEAIYDMLHDDFEMSPVCFDWVDLNDVPGLTDQDVEDILAERDDDARLPGSPDWGQALDASDFFGGYSLRRLG